MKRNNDDDAFDDAIDDDNDESDDNSPKLESEETSFTTSHKNEALKTECRLLLNTYNMIENEIYEQFLSSNDLLADRLLLFDIIDVCVFGRGYENCKTSKLTTLIAEKVQLKLPDAMHEGRALFDYIEMLQKAEVFKYITHNSEASDIIWGPNEVKD